MLTRFLRHQHCWFILLFCTLFQLTANARKTPPVDWTAELARAREIRKENPLLSLAILDSLLLADNYREPEQLATAYLRKARAYYALAEARDSVRYWLNRTDSLLVIYPAEKITLETAITHARLANVNNDSQTAISVLEPLRDRYLALGDTMLAINFYTALGHAHADAENLSASLEALLAAQDLNPGEKVPNRQIIINQAFATYYWENREWEKCLEIYEWAADYYRERNDLTNLQQALTNVGSLNKVLGRHEEALRYLEEVTRLQEQTGSLIGFFTARLNLVQLLVELDNFDRAYVISLENLDFAHQYGRDSAHILYWHGVIHRGMDRYDVAEDYIERAFREGRRKDHFGQCAFYSHALYQTYYWKDKFEPALEWYIIHSNYKDSLAQQRQEREMAPLLARLDNFEKTREIERLESEATIQKERRRQLWIALLLTALLGGGITYLQYRRRQLDKRLQAVELDNLNLANRQLEQDLVFKEKEIATHILNLAQRNAQLRELQTSLSDLPTDPSGKLNHQLERLEKRIDGHLEEDAEWNAFLESFQRLHHEFTPRLLERAPNLSAHEVRLSALLKINLSNREIANLLNITDEGLKKARYRLRKKLGLEGVGSLEEFLLKL